MSEPSDIVELPAIPSDAPEWVRALPSQGRFVDRTKFYDITGHLLFDSLLNSNGIRHYFYFMGDEKQAERIRNVLHGLPPQQDQSPSQGEVQVAFHLGQGICGHRGLVFSCVGPCFTANLNVDYVKPLRTPAWILVRAHVERQENRKVFVQASVEDGQGGIYAKAVVLFIQPKKSMAELLAAQ